MVMDYTLRIDRPADRVIPDLVKALERREFPVKLTFDLQLARTHQLGCDCPHHGTGQCTCQYAVLLVYARRPQSGICRTITAHGRDGQVWLNLLKTPALPARSEAVHEALDAELLEVLWKLAAASRAAIEEAPGAADAEVPSVGVGGPFHHQKEE